MLRVRCRFLTKQSKRTILPDHELTTDEVERYKAKMRGLLADRIKVLDLRCKAVIDSIELADGWVRINDFQPGGTDLFIAYLRETVERDLNTKRTERCPYCNLEFTGLFAYLRLLEHEEACHRDEVFRDSDRFMELVKAPFPREVWKSRNDSTS